MKLKIILIVFLCVGLAVVDWGCWWGNCGDWTVNFDVIGINSFDVFDKTDAAEVHKDKNSITDFYLNLKFEIKEYTSIEESIFGTFSYATPPCDPDYVTNWNTDSVRLINLSGDSTLNLSKDFFIPRFPDKSLSELTSSEWSDIWNYHCDDMYIYSNDSQILNQYINTTIKFKIQFFRCN